MDQDRQNSLRHDAQNTEREQDFTTYRTAQSSNDMVPTVFRRGIYRTIRGSLKRFLSIVVITALGVSVMCGLKAGCEDLRDSVDAYFDQQNVYDINVQSTYGLTRDDLAAIQEVDGVESSQGYLHRRPPTPPWAQRASAWSCRVSPRRTSISRCC